MTPAELRALDAEVAEKVMGEPSWRVHYPPDDVDKSDNWALSRTVSRDFRTKAEALAFVKERRLSGIPD
jgi:hypothetical protein